MSPSQPDWQSAGHTNLKIAALTESSYVKTIATALGKDFFVFELHDPKQFEQYILELPLTAIPEVILLEITGDTSFSLVEKIKSNLLLKGLIVVLIAEKATPDQIQKAKQLKVHDFYYSSFKIEDLTERLHFLVKFKFIRPNIEDLSKTTEIQYQVPFIKRLFDVVVSSIVLVLISPILLVIAIIIRLESKGPVVYKSKRVGTGYHIFDFYKFRSMRKDADAQLKELSKQLNQYTENEAGKSAFVKLKNDPRITRFGGFIRNTSLDELPQLFNILKGDMSFVGNRPLPLYEAEMLTSNEWAMRFLAPAGLTGLWQISKRGKEDMSERERKKLDNFYAQKHSFWLDLKIILGTFPALFTKEKV